MQQREVKIKEDLKLSPPPRPCMLPEKQSKCAQKSTTLSQEKKKIQGGGADQKYPPQHTEKIASIWREKTAHIQKYPP